MDGSAQDGMTLSLPRPEDAVAALREANLLFQRHLANWSSDVMGLRRMRLHLASWTAELPDTAHEAPFRHAA